MTTLPTGSARMTKTVLIIDDDPVIVRTMKDALGVFRHEHAYRIETAGDGADGLAALQRGQFDLVLLDMCMPRMTGLELLAQMRHFNLRMPVLMLTGNGDSRLAAAALASGIFAYVPKPFDLQQLEHLVSLAVSSRSTIAAA